jgi:hypothetical protein
MLTRLLLLSLLAPLWGCAVPEALERGPARPDMVVTKSVPTPAWAETPGCEVAAHTC